MKKTIYTISVLCALAFNSAFAQKGKVISAVKNYENLSYSSSKEQLLELASKENASGEFLERLGNAYYFNGEMEAASNWYGKLLNSNTPVNNEVYFRYAQSLSAQRDYVKAKEVLRKLAVVSPEDSRVKRFLSAPNYINEIEEISKDYDLVNLDINTSFSDFGTATNNDVVVFASSKNQNGKLYGWNGQPFLSLYELHPDGTTKELPGAINTKYHESSVAFTEDGGTVYFTRNNFFKGKLRKNNKDTHALKIYKATLENGEWVDIESLPFNSDAYSVAHPALSPDEKKLYFASDMPGTYGGSDIYVVDIKADGTYGEVLNLGANVNTEGRENFPFMSESGMLYYASDGHLGLGGLDVFKIDSENFSGGVIQNMGKPINSSKDDFGFIINEASQKGYVSSNRAGGKGDDDIYSFEVPKCATVVAGTVVNKLTQEVIADAEVVIKNASNDIVKTFTTNALGEFKWVLECDAQRYSVTASKATYKPDTSSFATDKKSELILKMALQPEPEAPKVAEVGTDLFKLLNLNPIYFDYDKAFIRPDAEIELVKIINYMHEFPGVKIDVRSHTDSRGRDAYNLQLSQRRNKSTIEYIINKGGLLSSRLTGKGYGETQLTNHCGNGVKCSKLQHQANRRSEFIVIAN